MTRYLLITTLAMLVLVLLVGCGGSGVPAERVAKLQGRISKLEMQNAELRHSLAATTATVRSRLKAIDRRTQANDDALYEGVAMAQDGVICSFRPGCHVPLGSPGAVYTDVGKPGRIFATPFP
jgi:hypothetical protein